jgi:hypothetical protein
MLLCRESRGFVHVVHPHDARADSFFPTPTFPPPLIFRTERDTFSCVCVCSYVLLLFFVFMRPALEIALNPFHRERAKIHCCYERLGVAHAIYFEWRVG